MILDPSLPFDSSRISGEINKADLPYLDSDQIRFGYVPDLDCLMPGDLLLSESVDRNIISNAIAKTQESQTEDGNGWTHAAIYAREARIVEATPTKDVTSSTIYSWVPWRKIMARRPKFSDVTSDHEKRRLGLELALEVALHQSSGRYSKKTALDIFFRLRSRNRNRIKRGNNPEEKTESYVCSGLYADCYRLAMKDRLVSIELERTQEPITPALLSGISTLETIELKWRKLI